MQKHRLPLILLFIFIPTLLIANTTGVLPSADEPIVHKMATLVFQLSFILFAAWLGGFIFTKFKFPSVLGEIISGMIIGPYFLGKFPIFGFEHGIFPLTNPSFPVSVELYSYATVASIVLLFIVGLETDIKTFFKYSFAGSMVGIGGVIASFVLGDIAGILFLTNGLGKPAGFLDIVPLFMGAISTATSVGITARILSDNKKMDSPEGVTIISAAVVDDVLGIIVLAIIIGIAKSGHIVWKEVSIIGLKAISIWLAFTALGLTFAYKISSFLKFFKDKTSISIMAFALALFLSGIFEKSGLAMIIGSYIMGLSLSKTDISLIIQENLHSLQRFFIPIFFCVMGMMVDITQMGSPIVIQFGLLYLILGILGKLLGCMIPSLFLNFNGLGALRIGVGMIPRGEVALIIVGIGLSSGILEKEVLSIAIIMTFLTTLLTPPFLEKLFQINKKGTKKQVDDTDSSTEEIIYDVPNEETSELLLIKILSSFEEEGFFVHILELEGKIYQIRKEEKIVSLKYLNNKLIFNCLKKDAPFIHTLFFEVLADLENIIKNLKTLTNKEKIAKEIFTVENTSNLNNDILSLKKIISPLSINIHLKGQNKQEILNELVDTLISSGHINFKNKKEVLEDLLAREASMTTGLQNHIAFPHARTNTVNDIVVGIGIKKEGVDFKSLDGKPAKLFIITLAPKNSANPYLKFISDISQIIAKQDINVLINVNTAEELYTKLTTSK